MPHTTIISEKFAEAVRTALGALSPGQASFKTGVSYEYLRRMVMGHVPSEVILERFAKGMDADLMKLRIAAGYEEAEDPVERIAAVLGRATSEGKMTDDQQRRILEYATKILKKSRSGRAGGGSVSG